jgi:ribonuclease P protein subunit POP4
MKSFTGELVGQHIEVVESSNQSTIVGMKGKIVDETQQTLVVEVNGERKTLLKHAVVIRLDSGEVVEGRTIMKRPEERMKGK